MTIKTKASKLQQGDRISTITGDVAIVKDVSVNGDNCLIMFESGLSFFCFPDEVHDIFRPTIKEKYEINS